jgi:hypothetical protein
MGDFGDEQKKVFPHAPCQIASFLFIQFGKRMSKVFVGQLTPDPENIRR